MYINGVPIDPWNWFWWLIGLLVCVAIICAIVRTIIHAVRGDRYYHHHHHWDERKFIDRTIIKIIKSKNRLKLAAFYFGWDEIYVHQYP
jgi:hypothetical protein